MSRLPAVEAQAREGRLYTSLILHGASHEVRMDQAMRLARILLCASGSGRQDCDCRHCRRIRWPLDDTTFHPDVGILGRDLTMATSADSIRKMLRTVRLRPFEARGQVFIVSEAETLTDEAASALLKVLEEPPRSAPRNFLLLCPNPALLLSTIRSRSMSIYMGTPEEPDRDCVLDLGERFASLLHSYAESGSPAFLLAAAQILHQAAGWDDPLAARPWTLSAAALLEAHRRGSLPGTCSGAVLDLAGDLLELGPQIRLRRVPAQRILEGLVVRHLAGASSGNAE